MSADTVTATPAPHDLDEPGWRARALPRLRNIRLTRTTILLGLLVMVGVSVWLRTVQIHLHYWIDEGIAVTLASHPLAHIPALMRQDGSPPLYYLILHVWMSMFGRTEVSTHALSIIFALLAIPAGLWAGTRLFGRRAGLATAILLAGAPYLTTYADETRMYAFVALLSVFVAAGFVQSFVLRRRRWLPVFSLSLAISLYTHNWGLFLGLACGVAFLWCVWRSPAPRRALWIDGVIGFGAVAVLFLPWLPTLLYQSRHTGAPWDLPPVLWNIPQGLYFITGGRGVAMLLLFGGGAGLWTLVQRTLPGAAGGLAVSGAADTESAVARDARPDAVQALRRAAECLLILGLGTMVIAYLYSKHSPAWTPRYFAVLIGPLALLFGLGLARGGRLAVVALALTAVFWILDPVPTNVYTKSNVAIVAKELAPEMHADSLVLSTQPEQVPVIHFYLPGVRSYATPLGYVRDPGVVDWRDALKRLERSSVHGVLAPMIARLRPGQRIMLLTPMSLPHVPLYLKLVDRATVRWSYFLKHDPTLQRLGSSVDKYWDSGGDAVEASVWQKR